MQIDISGKISMGYINSICQNLESQREIDEIVELTSNEDSRIASNAAWILNHVDEECKWRLQRYQRRFIDIILKTGNTTLRRLLLSIVEQQPFHEEDLRTEFIDFCLSKMASPSEPPGVQSLCMKLSYKQCQFYPELLDEMRRTLELMEISQYAKSVKCVRLRIMNNKYNTKNR